MGLSQIEKEIHDQRQKALLDKQRADKKRRDYKSERKNFFVKYNSYLSEMENEFWACSYRIENLIGRKIDPYFKRRRLLYIIPLSSIKEGQLKVKYDPAFDVYHLYITLEVIEDKNSKNGAYLSFRGNCFHPGGRVNAGIHSSSSSKADIFSKFNISEFDKTTASAWLDDQFENLYRAIKRTFPAEIR